MALSPSSPTPEDIRCSFTLREGTYKLVNTHEFSKPLRNLPSFNQGATSYQNTNQATPANPQVQVSAVTINSSGNLTLLCYNYGREIYVYSHSSLKQSPEGSRTIDKRVYKGTSPTCHDFNTVGASVDGALLAIGFSAGQIQLIDPIRKDYTKLYNEDRLVEKTRATCIKWVPESSNHFLVAHESGKLYTYNEELPCSNGTAPNFQTFKRGEKFSVYTCKAKSTRNPLYKWDLGDACINEFQFSPCGKYLAVVSRDGLLRVFNYNEMEVMGVAKSYFGSLLCLAWSPDSKYVVVGGEDDLLTVWSLGEKRIVARGQGHKSWVSALAFDPYISAVGSDFPPDEESGSLTRSRKVSGVKCGSCYRLGSVGQDAQVCFWDLTEDVLKQPINKRVSVMVAPSTNSTLSSSGGGSGNSKSGLSRVTNLFTKETTPNDASDMSLSQRLSYLTMSDRKKDEKGKKISAPPRERHASARSVNLEDLTSIGSIHCPRLHERPLIEPLVCKKVALERLTCILFFDDCFVLSCQEGILYTWQRPRRVQNGTEIREGTMV